MNFNINDALMPFLGGLTIAFSSTLMLAGLGRITGISGIIGSILTLSIKENLWRIIFILGLALGGTLMWFTNPEFFNYEIKDSYLKIIIAGLLVGFGTRLGSGCTSGHGVCGLARLAKRSFLATVTFITAGIITVLIFGV